MALIPDADWEKGPEHIAGVIEEIRREFEREKSAEIQSAPKQVTDNEREHIKQTVTANREALALSLAGVLGQLEEFREKVRGLNHLDPDFRDELIEFIDQLSDKLKSLLHDLPMTDEVIDDEKANRLVLWLREFRPLVKKSAAKYATPENVAEAAVPTGIILGCTAIGSLVGPAGAGVGALVGGLITNQVKPGKAADELLKSGGDEPPTE